MKKYIVGISFLLLGCRASVVYAPRPAEPLAMSHAVRAGGVLLPQEFYFTLISQYEEGKARAVFLAEPALPLADMTVSARQVVVHEKAARVPESWVRAWGKLVQTQFLTPCPARTVKQPAAGLRGQFELQVTGGICQ